MPEPGSAREAERSTWKGQQQAWLIKSTVELLGTVSINDLSVAQLARHAGVSRPLFYAYFDSKYDLLAAALSEVWEELESETQHLSAARPDDGDLVGVVRRLVSETFDLWLRHRPLLQAFVQARHADPAIAEMWKRMIRRRNENAMRMAERLLAGNQIHPITDDLPALMDALQGMTTWALTNEVRNPGVISLDRMIDTHTALWLHAFWGGADAAPQPGMPPPPRLTPPDPDP